MNKIAIIRRNGLGDLLCTLPLYALLKKKYPHAKITFFVDEFNAPLLKYFPEKINFVTFPKNGNKYLNLIRLGLLHRREKFDLAISTKTSPMKMMNFFLFLLGAKKRVAVSGMGWSRKWITHPVVPKEGIHQALKALRMEEPDMEEIPEDFVPKIKVERKHSLPLLLMSATTTRVQNKLEEKRYAAIVNRLYLKRNFSVMLLSQEEDRRRAEIIKYHLNPPTEVFFPRNFDEFMLLLAQADLYFLGDGGVAHIGAALDKHAVVFFGDVLPEEWGPMSAKCLNFYHEWDVNYLSEEQLLEGLLLKYDEAFK